MPMPSQIGGLDRHHDVVAGPCRDDPVAVGADVVLGGLVGLQEAWFHLAEMLELLVLFRHGHPRKAQASSRTTTSRPAATYSRSNGRRRCGRVGSSPMMRIIAASSRWSTNPPSSACPQAAGYRAGMVGVRRVRHPALVLAARIGVLLAAGLAGVACSSADLPEVPLDADGVADPVLARGREIYGDRCANCHGRSGGGGRGPKLAGGAVMEKYPDLGAQIEIVADGATGMPSFDEVLTATEIDAVVRYTREVF